MEKNQIKTPSSLDEVFPNDDLEDEDFMEDVDGLSPEPDDDLVIEPPIKTISKTMPADTEHTQKKIDTLPEQPIELPKKKNAPDPFKQPEERLCPTAPIKCVTVISIDELKGWMVPNRKMSNNSAKVSIRQSGQVAFNAAACTLHSVVMSGAKFATLLVEKKSKNKEIAIHFSPTQDHPASVPLVQSKGGSSIFSDKGFFESIEYDMSNTKTFISKLNKDGLVVIDLSSGIVVERKANARKKSDQDSKGFIAKEVESEAG